LIVAHHRGALLRHRAGHLLAGFAGPVRLANTDVAIAHDGYPSLDCELRQRGTNRKSCTVFDWVGAKQASVHTEVCCAAANSYSADND
jgi:hypothetical protein